MDSPHNNFYDFYGDYGDDPSPERMRAFNDKSVVHMFLTKKTPDRVEDDLHEIEDDMLAHVANSVSKTVRDTNSGLLTPVQVMLERWMAVQPSHEKGRNSDVLISELGSLEFGNTIPIYVREQNCTMMISKVANQKFRIQTFRPSLPSDTIMSSVGSLQMDFPETSEIIENSSLLLSKIFNDHVYEMALESFQLSMKSIEKGGSTFSDTRDVPRPFLVTDWAVGVLVPKKDSEKITISKKIRDQVTMTSQGSRTLLPFRRSGMWMSIKVALQLKLLDFLKDRQTAKLVYKILMLRVLVDACNEYEKLQQSFDLDIASQMLAKVGRRVAKLKMLECGDVINEMRNAVELIRSTVLDYTLDITSKLGKTTKRVWQKVQNEESVGVRTITRSRDDFVRDLIHTIEPLNKMVERARQLVEKPKGSTNFDIEAAINKTKSSIEQKIRYNTMGTILSGSGMYNYNVDHRIWLHDTERFIKKLVEGASSSEKVFDLANTYLERAREEYKNNPVGFSQMILVSLKLVYILDRIAIAKHPLLKEYQPKIETSILDYLLLPHQRDVELLNKLVEYFNYRDSKGSKPILERTVDTNTFSVRYAKDDVEMRALKTRIQSDIERKKRQKFEEADRVRKECYELERKKAAHGNCCTCQHEWNEERTRRVRVTRCGFCPPSCQLGQIRKTVLPYEIPLPPQEHLANAVVFELLIPEEISHLRQLLAIFKYELLGMDVFGSNENGVSKNWLDYSPIGIYSPFRGRGNVITMGSTVRPTSETYHSTRGPDLLFSSNEEFAVYCGMNCHFSYNPRRSPFKTFKEHCAFQIKFTADSNAYSSLQNYLESTDHHQNNVLAHQTECHADLTLNEFLTFGSLRAGHRIQLRNLYMALSNRSLTLEKEPVLALILQTIWQVGPQDENGNREVFADFQQTEFALEFLEMLKKLVKSNEANYSIPLVLLTAILITGRILEVNKTCREKCVGLMKEWRQLTRTWCDKIENELRKDDSSSKEKNRVVMHKILHEIKMCSMMTFNVFCYEEVNKAIDDPEDMAHYLHTLSSKHLLNKESNSSFSGFMGILKFIESNIPLRLRLETTANRNREGISKFMKEKFPPVRGYNNFELDSTKNVVSVQFSNDHYITIDMLTGELLINGYPETELSSQISGNTEFRRFFQNHLNFRVQRQSESVLGTVDPIHGKRYEFITNTSSRRRGCSDLDIVEIQEDQPRLVLLPHGTFRGFISDHFVDNYTHWVDPIKERIYFRKIATNEGGYNLPPEYEMMRWRINGQGNGWMFHDEVRQDYLMSIKSNGFALVTEALSRLELQKYINVSMDKEMKSVKAHLPRHNLRFTLQSNGLLESLEYPGFQICVNQNCGTFIRLRHGLLLHNGTKHSIIVPHGKINVWGKSGAHHACGIDLESIAQPSFYIYELDEVLKRIVAKKSISAWLYLAALHAITASSQPDPFTGKTGTEMAVGILQLSLVWSCSPYDKESLEILKFIKGISPSRQYYGHKLNYGRNQRIRESIETIECPKVIPSLAEFDGYSLLVDKLISDSIRLQTLHPIKDECKELYRKLEEENSCEKLLVRAYLRNLDKYNDEVRINEDLIFASLNKYEPNNPTQLALRQEKDEFALSSMLSISYNRHLFDKSVVWALSRAMLKKDSLIPFLFTNGELLPAENEVDMALSNILSLKFRPSWLTYYSLATSDHDHIGRHEWTLLLSALASRGAPLEQVNILHCICLLKNDGKQKFPPVPYLPQIDNPIRIHYVASEIVKILENHSEKFPRSYSDFDDEEDYKAAKKAYSTQLEQNCKIIAQWWNAEFWPCPSISNEQLRVLKEAKIKATALPEVNNLINSWYQAREMKQFMDDVQKKLNESVDMIASLNWKPTAVETEYDMIASHTIITPLRPSAVKPIRLEDLMDRIEPNDLATEAQEIFERGNFEAIEIDHDWRRSKNACKSKITQIRETVEATILNNIYHKILDKTGLVPRITPLSLLRTLKSPRDHVLQKYAGALGVLWTHLKRLNRIMHFEMHRLQADLEREIKNSGHMNWSPAKWPEWLLLELELDIMIRSVQVEVAERMMRMPNDSNGVMQLNMGEGKTSVIVPMLAVILAREDSLCRVTVLSSIFKMNWDILKFAIGGLLNRRLYSFPSRRDMKMDLDCVNDIQKVYQECLKMRGVVLTLPEYRLSFRSLAYDKILPKEETGSKKQDTAVGLKLLQTEDWLRYHARDILDESDELLNVKYQLVYTIGSKAPVDGGNIRWTMCQEVLNMIQDIAPQLLKSHGSMIEFDEARKRMYPHEFAHIRLLAGKESDFIHEFERVVAETYLPDLDLSESEEALVSQFLLSKEISEEAHEQIMTVIKKDTDLHHRVLMLAGYIHRGVLALALSKRWRVEYGVDLKGAWKMAVPFRAKDVAAERTEFGHPDLAIILTHLSYYYSGLTDPQLEEVLKILRGKQTPKEIYSEWINEIPEDQVPASLTDYYSLNLKDAMQKSALFDLIRRHKIVVDFWLSHVVFPRESKQFPGKLVMTAWDLVYERQRLPVTGFSGTNDSIVLLPLTIHQQDLESLSGTNDKMENILLRPENIGHRSLKMGVSCDEILKQMKEDKLSILIDSGALMLELDNEQVAERWLEVDLQIQAVVYFNNDNELMVKSRNSGVETKKKRWGPQRPASTRKIPDVPFELSPYQGKLGDCGVFLDDQHTRGTDLKFPINSKACVTVGTRMKRDKLLQACLRLRKLGHGQSVAFYLSHEASIKVGSPFSTGSVLNWVKQNTEEFNDDGLLHWAIAGKNYAQRLAAEDIFHFPYFKYPTKCEYGEAKAKILASKCVDKEVHLLMDMYGQHSKWELLHELIAKWFGIVWNKLTYLNGSSPPVEVSSRFREIQKEVIQRCLENVPEKRQLSSSAIMDEEQEKELELEKEAEVEEERQVQRPRKCKAAEPSLHPNVIAMVMRGGVFQIIDGVKRLSDIFMDTNFAGLVQPNDWAVEVYATKDFISVITPDFFFRTNDYLRPMEYFVSNMMANGVTQILFLSPYEVNLLLPLFRNHETSCRLHMFATRKFEKQDMLMNLPRLQLPPIPEGSFCVVQSKSREMAALLVASGSLYFDNHEEQKAFALFLSIVPRQNRKFFQRGSITRTGFLLPRYRGNMGPQGFQRDSTELVWKILGCRHPVRNDVAHVVRFLEKKRFVNLKERECQQEGN